MFELDRWIVSPDIASWLAERPALHVREQTDCILAAPHRTLAEKLEALRLLKEEGQEALERFESEKWEAMREGRLKKAEGLREVQKARRSSYLVDLGRLIETGEYLTESLLHASGRNPGHRLYQLALYHHGSRVEKHRDDIFSDAGDALGVLKEQFRATAGESETDRKEYFGVIRVFQNRRRGRLEHRWNLILDSEGEALYGLPESGDWKMDARESLGDSESPYIRLPYATGTVLSMAENPFFPPLMGVLVNEREPWEEGFGFEDDQWLLYPDFRQKEIGAVRLDDYASLVFGADFLLPFRQFLRRQEGALDEGDQWLAKLGELVSGHKECVAWILQARAPGLAPTTYDRCREQVQGLCARIPLKKEDRESRCVFPADPL